VSYKMIELETDLVGKHAHFGTLRDYIKKYGFSIGGNWEYDRGSFDTILHQDQEEGETIYLRLPFKVLTGQLDDYNTDIIFQKPYVIKHVANIGLEYDGSSLADATGFSQFQTPADQDGQIQDKGKWIQAGEQLVVEKVLPHVN